MTNKQRVRVLFLSYRVVLTLNVFSFLAFAAVIGIGISFESLPVTLIGVAITILFLLQSAFLIRIGKRGWNTRLERAKRQR